MITAPTIGPGAGLAIVFDRGLIGSQGIVGRGQLTINGSLYGPNIILGSTGMNTMTVNNGRVVVNQILFASGNPILKVTAPPKVPQPVPDGPVRLVRTS
jgi:hypothetical protein